MCFYYQSTSVLEKICPVQGEEDVPKHTERKKKEKKKKEKKIHPNNHQTERLEEMVVTRANISIKVKVKTHPK
jgi:hypothetical protein